MTNPAPINRLTYTKNTNFSDAAPGVAPSNGWRLIPAEGVPKATKENILAESRETNSYGTSSRSYKQRGRCELGFKSRLFHGAAAATATKCFLKEILEDYLNATATQTPTAMTVGVASGAGKTANLKVNSTTSCTVGMGIFVGPAAGSSGEFRIITAVVSATELTLDQDLSVAANYASGATVYPCFNFLPAVGAKTSHLWLNQELSGHTDLLGAGTITDLKFTGLAAGEGGFIEAMFQGDDFTTGVTPTTVVDDYTNNGIIVAKGSAVSIDNTDVAVADVNFSPNIKWTWQPATSGTNGRQGTTLVSMENPVLEMTEYYVAGRWTKYADRSVVPVRFMFHGSALSTNAQKATGGFGLFMPACEIKVDEAELDGMRAQKVTFKGINPAYAATSYGFSSLTKPFGLYVLGGAA